MRPDDLHVHHGRRDRPDIRSRRWRTFQAQPVHEHMRNWYAAPHDKRDNLILANPESYLNLVSLHVGVPGMADEINDQMSARTHNKLNIKQKHQ